MIGGYKSMQDSINKKADRDELADLEARLMAKLNEILSNLFGQFADKKETNKRFLNLEKNVSLSFL